MTGATVIFDQEMQQIEVADDNVEHVPEIVDDPTGQASDASGFLRVNEVRLQLLAFGHVEPHSQDFAIRHDPGRSRWHGRTDSVRFRWPPPAIFGRD